MDKRKTILVTGAGGFVGGHLVHYLVANGYYVRALARIQQAGGGEKVDWRVSPDLNNSKADWASLLDGVGCVIHLAARVHIMNETAEDPMAKFQSCNVDGTRRLFGAAQTAGVENFIFLSTIKVNGEATQGAPFRATDEPQPKDAYALSKWDAEQLLKSGAGPSMSISIIRPPLIYGPGVKGNMRTLVRAVRKGVPLPLANIQNQRHMLSVDNLLSLIGRLIKVQPAGFNIFLVADREAISISELIREIARQMERSPRLFSLPLSVLRFLVGCVGKTASLDRLTGDLEIDIGATCDKLNWEPEISWQLGIAKMLACGDKNDFRSTKNGL